MILQKPLGAAMDQIVKFRHLVCGSRACRPSWVAGISSLATRAPPFDQMVGGSFSKMQLDAPAEAKGLPRPPLPPPLPPLLLPSNRPFISESAFCQLAWIGLDAEYLPYLGLWGFIKGQFPVEMFTARFSFFILSHGRTDCICARLAFECVLGPVKSRCCRKHPQMNAPPPPSPPPLLRARSPGGGSSSSSSTIAA